MNIKNILSVTYTSFSKLSASSLIKAFQSLREKYTKLEKENNALKVENERLKALLKKQKIQSINKDANKPVTAGHHGTHLWRLLTFPPPVSI